MCVEWQQAGTAKADQRHADTDEEDGVITAGRIKYITGCNRTQNRTQRTETHGYAENGAEGSQPEQLG